MKKMRKRNDGETLWAYINEWLKRYWWLCLIIQTVISGIYCGIIYLVVQYLSIELKIVCIVYILTFLFIIIKRMASSTKFKPLMDWSFGAIYIIYNVAQIIVVISAMF